MIGLIDIQYDESGVDSSESRIFKLKGYNFAFSVVEQEPQKFDVGKAKRTTQTYAIPHPQ
ncbi:MAG: hypothetical protein EZS28_054619, partial [Streblomastix strix]